MQNIVEIIKKGGVGVLPTDTLYGLVGSAFSKEVLNRIYAIKGRDESKPCIVLIASIRDIQRFGITLTGRQRAFLEKIWPGPVSVILPCPKQKFSYLHRGTKSVAFRLPKNKVLQDILEQTGPLVAPSANPQSLTPAQTIAKAKEYFGDKVDFYVTGKINKKPSTVVKIEDKSIILVREGAKRLPKSLFL